MTSFDLSSQPNEWLDLLRRYRTPVVTVLVSMGIVISLIDLGWLILIGNRTLSIECPNPEPVREATISGQILIDVRGEVVKPGVYAMSSTQRLGDAIQEAGGLTKSAHAPYVLHALNFAQPLEDAQKIYIPHEQETAYCQPINQFSPEAKLATDGNQLLISINAASLSELETLTGIGAKRAEDIVAGRPYQSVNQLLEQKILTTDVFEQIKTQIRL